MHPSTNKYADKSIRNMIFVFHKYSMFIVDKSKIKRKKSFRASNSVQLVFLLCLLLEGKFSGNNVANDKMIGWLWWLWWSWQWLKDHFFQFNRQLHTSWPQPPFSPTAKWSWPTRTSWAIKWLRRWWNFTTSRTPTSPRTGSRSLRHQGGEHHDEVLIKMIDKDGDDKGDVFRFSSQNSKC